VTTSNCACSAPPSDKPNLLADSLPGEISIPSCALQAPIRAATWRLQDLKGDLVQFYEKVAKAKGVTLDILLGGLSDSFQVRGYSLEEFQGNLDSLRAVITTRTPGLDALVPWAMEPRANGQSANNPLILYLDPTCDVCTHRLLLVQKMIEACPSESPAIVLRALPADTEASMDSAVMLRKIREDSPDEFIGAFFETSMRVAENPAVLPEVASHYFGTASLKSLPWYPEVRKRVEGDRSQARAVFPARAFPPPIILFNGRVLQKRSGDEFPFDPLHDPLVLLRTLQLISAYDSMVTRQTGR
jgi:hypothetical protein